ncbi:NADPH:quinone reductase [Roseomonas sp. BN140053]|uniref:NADPH:quinone reductase n=1 Tax=Roseomonas sp. BN140053 TaxID=3391898 RepID=UPI0039EBBB9A
MRAAWYERTGPAREVLQLGTLPDPVAGPGEVLVRIRASGVNPHDTKRRAGWRGMAGPARRSVPHGDGAGEVVAVGEGVSRDRLGERVWLWNAPGTAAELCALPAEQAVPLPAEADFAAGACLGVPACTAHDAVFADGPVAGMCVLVHGAAGAVGEPALRFAARAGARVLATASTPDKAAVAREAGAAAVFNYRDPDCAQQVLAATGGRGVDRIIEVDLGANLALDVAIVANNGSIASYSSTRVPEPVLPYYPLAYKGVALRLVQGMILPPARRTAAAEAIAVGLRDGWLAPRIGARFPLAEIAAAHEALEGGRQIGNVVVEV